MPSHPGFVDLLRTSAEKSSDSVAFAYTADGETTESVTLFELLAEATALVDELKASTKLGDFVLVVCGDHRVAQTAFLACAVAGRVAVPIPPATNAMARARTAAIAKDCGATAILSSDFEENEQARPAPGLASIALSPDSADFDFSKWVTRKSDDLLLVQYTSGSTSSAKGVCVTSENIVANAEHLRHGTGLASDWEIVSWLPLFHDLGLALGLWLPLLSGVPALLVDRRAFVRTPTVWLRSIALSDLPTLSGAPDFAWRRLLSEPPEPYQDLDLSSLRCALSGAERIRPDTLDAVTEMLEPLGFRKSSFWGGYGMAEATVMVTGTKANDEPPRILVSRAGLSLGEAVEPTDTADEISLVACGDQRVGAHFLIVDPATNKPQVDRSIGEVWVADDNVASGYLNRSDDDKFGNRISDDDRDYYRTGDLAFLDSGSLYFAGRLNDCIVRGAVNYWPDDIEEDLARAAIDLPIGPCCAFSGDDLSDSGPIFVMVELLSPHDEAVYDVFEKLTIELRETTGIEQLVVQLVSPRTIPRTTSGKVQRSLTQQRWLREEIDPVATLPRA